MWISPLLTDQSRIESKWCGCMVGIYRVPRGGESRSQHSGNKGQQDKLERGQDEHLWKGHAKQPYGWKAIIVLFDMWRTDLGVSIGIDFLKEWQRLTELLRSTLTLLREWDKALKKRPESIRLWADYINLRQTNFSSFSFTECVKVFEDCILTLNKVARRLQRQRKHEDNYDGKWYGKEH